MDEKSCFIGNLSKGKDCYVKVYPLSTISMLSLIEKEKIEIEDIYIEINDDPAKSLTEMDFEKKLLAKELCKILATLDNAFIMSGEFRLLEFDTRFNMDDDTEVTIRGSKDNVISLLRKISGLFFKNNGDDIIYLIGNQSDKLFCLNQDASLWKTFDTVKEFLNDEEAMKYY
jgi:hypothetical protein